MLIYALVATGPLVLAEFSTKTGNFKDIARAILQEIPRTKHRKSYSAENVNFHYISEEEGLVFLCMADADSKTRLPFAFLEDIKARFISKFGRSIRTYNTEGALNDVFCSILSDQMHYFNTNPTADPMRKLQDDIDSVRDVMIQNIDKVFARGEKIEVLVDQTDKLKDNSFAFKKGATSLKRRLCCKNIGLSICLLILCAVLLIIIIIIIVVVLKVLGVF